MNWVRVASAGQLVTGAVNTIAGYGAMHLIRKGQVPWLLKGDVTAQVRFIAQTLGIAA